MSGAMKVEPVRTESDPPQPIKIQLHFLFDSVALETSVVVIITDLIL